MVTALSFAFVPVCLGQNTESEQQATSIPATTPPPPSPPILETPQDTVIERIPKLEYYPCDQCHITKADCNPQKRVLTEHTDKGVHFADKSGEEDRWCHACHKPGEHSRFKLFSGKEIGFNEVYMLCGECHGTQYMDWKRNLHGKRIGLWNGPREVYSCPECHNPHKPGFKPLKPKPPPDLPRGKSRSFIKLLLGDLIHEKQQEQQKTQKDETPR